MSGGFTRSIGLREAPPAATLLAAIAIVGSWIAGVGLAEPPAVKPAVTPAPKASTGGSEKSVIVATGDETGASTAVTASSTTDAETLEPIPAGAEAEVGTTPDLADPPVEIADGEPTLADDYADIAAADAADMKAKKPKADASAVGTEIRIASAGPEETSVAAEETLTASAVAEDSDSDSAAIASEESSEPAVAVQPRTASFHGITPGESTREDALAALGTPVSEVKPGVLKFDFPRCPSVTVAIDEDDIVASINVELANPASAATLIEKLGMSEIRTAAILENGEPISTLFPERGVTFKHKSPLGDVMVSDGASQALEGAEAVYEIVVEPINAAAFLVRAKCGSPTDCVQRITDLETALSLDGSNVEARFLLSQVKLSIGDAVDAEELAKEAVQLAPKDNSCRLQWARSLKYLAKYSQAVEQVRTVLDGATATPLERAQALEQMGQLAMLGSMEVQSQAAPMLSKAIELADPIAGSGNRSERIAAGKLLVEAHLTMAEQIAAGHFQKKEETISSWIARASGLSEHMIASGEADASLRLDVAVSALAAGAHLDPPINPELWVREAELATEDLHIEKLDLPLRDQLNWQLGLAYFYAADISHRRSQPEEALKYGQLAEATLTPAADSRRDLPDTDYVLGRLYFQIGAVHAVHKQDHDAACQWYDRAVEPLMKPVPLTNNTSPAKHGDALVSMGVSYWQTGQRERAYELTQSGLSLIQQGVKEGLLSSEAIDVPRNNLAAMDRVLGRGDFAPKKPEMAVAAKANGGDAEASEGARGRRVAAAATSNGGSTKLASGQKSSRSASSGGEANGVKSNLAGNERRTPQTRPGSQRSQARVADRRTDSGDAPRRR